MKSVRTGLQIRPIKQVHTRTALESRPHSFLFAIFETTAGCRCRMLLCYNFSLHN